MMKEELELIEDRKQPLDAAVTTFCSIQFSWLIPLISFIVLYISGSTVSAEYAVVYSVIALKI